MLHPMTNNSNHSQAAPWIALHPGEDHGIWGGMKGHLYCSLSCPHPKLWRRPSWKLRPHSSPCPQTHTFPCSRLVKYKCPGPVLHPGCHPLPALSFLTVRLGASCFASLSLSFLTGRRGVLRGLAGDWTRLCPGKLSTVPASWVLPNCFSPLAFSALLLHTSPHLAGKALSGPVASSLSLKILQSEVYVL